MIQIFCDVCGESRKFRSGINGDYRLWFTTIEMRQICDEGKKIPSNSAVDICYECRDALLDGGEPNTCWDRPDDCLIKALRMTLKNKQDQGKDATNKTVLG